MSRPFRLGLFIVTALVIFGAAVFLIGKRQFLLASTYKLTATFKNVDGLLNGAEVHVGGINQGTVTRIDLPKEPGGQMTVLMKMDRSTLDVIRQDSVASIATDGLLGDKHIELAFGSPEAARVEDGAALTSVESTDLSDVMAQTKNVMGDLQATAVQLREIGAKINSGQGTVGSLVNDRRLYDQLTAAATGMQDNMNALKHNFLLSGFFKNRGYDDPAQLTRHLIPSLPRGEPMASIPIRSAKLFAADDSAKLKDTKVLDEAGRALAAGSFGLAVVVARGGPTGDSGDLEMLAQARAMNVRDYLVEHYPMDDTRLKTFAVAKTPEPNGDSSIEVRIYPAGTRVTPTKSGR